jgi:hypothetical protein
MFGSSFFIAYADSLLISRDAYARTLVLESRPRFVHDPVNSGETGESESKVVR